MRQIGKRLVSILLCAMTAISLVSPLGLSTRLIDIAHAESGSGGGASYAGGGTVTYNGKGTFNTSRSGIRVYLIDRSGNRVSNIADIVYQPWLSDNATLLMGDTGRTEELQVHWRTIEYPHVEIYQASTEGVLQHWVANPSNIEAQSETIQYDSNGDGTLDATYTNKSNYSKLVPIISSDFSGRGDIIGNYFTGEQKLLPKLATLSGGGSGSNQTDSIEDGQTGNILGEQIETISNTVSATFNIYKQQYDKGVISKTQLETMLYEDALRVVESLTNSGLYSQDEVNVLNAALQKAIDDCMGTLPEQSASLNIGNGLFDVAYAVTDTQSDTSENNIWDIVNSLYDTAYAAETEELKPIYRDEKITMLLEARWYGVDLLYVKYDESKKVYDSDGTLNVLQTLAKHDYILMMEPVMWNRLQDDNKNTSRFYFYGTPYNLGQFLQAQKTIPNGWSNGGQTGGWIGKGTHRAIPWSMYTENDLELTGYTIKAGSTSGLVDTKLTDAQMADRTIGHSLHFYEFSLGDLSTHTWDNNKYPDSSTFIEHPAPDPAVDPPTKDSYEENKDKWIWRIVKVYDQEIVAPDGQKTIEHVYTGVREDTLSKIEIQDEIEAGGYEVVNWKYSDYYVGVIEGFSKDAEATGIQPTEWEDIEIQSATPVDPTVQGAETSGTEPATVDIADPNDSTKERTLYVELRKKIEIPETTTWDEPNYPGPNVEPHPAPDPTTQTKKPPVDPDNPYIVHRIVKVYQQENEDTGEITYITTTVRDNTAPIIEITSEGEGENKWELIEWKYADTLEGNPTYRDWEDEPIVSVVPIGSGRAETTQNIMDSTDIYKSRTLYVLLRRKVQEIPQPPGDIIIRQSQISKAIHTDATTIPGRWGNYEFVASIGTFQLTHTAYYDHGCCGSCDPPCGSCHGHTCKLEMPGRNGDNKLNFVFDQIGAEESLQIKTGVHSDTDPKVYIPNGQHPETIGSMYAADNVYEYVSDGNQQNGAELVTVLWRGGATPTDIPTLAKYKQTDIQNRYGSANWQIPQAMLKNASNTSHKTRATGPSVNSLSITFGIDQNASDLYGTASCVTHNGYNCIYRDTRRVYMIAGTEFDYDFDAQVAVHFYAGEPKGLAAQPFGGPASTVMKQEDTSGPHYENTIIQGKQQIKFYPYIKMTYMTNSLKLAELEEANTDTYVNKTRYETYVLSEWESSILPSDAVEVGWKNNNEGESLMLTSQQWSLHQKAVNGGQAWNGANQVLPGGAIYQLSTPSNNLTTVDLVTYQTVVDQKTRQYLSSTLSGDEYTEAKVAQDHTDFVNDVKETIDNLRIVQWVRALSEREWKNLQGKPASSIPNAWPIDWAENPGDGSICVRGGGESLNELDLPGVTSSETKYYMHKAAELLDYQSAELKDITKDIMSGSQETASEGDLDIISLSNTTTVFKVFTDTAGNVYMASVSATGTDNEQIITDLVSQLRDVNADTVATGATGVDAVRLADRTTSGEEINSVLSGDAKQIDDRTKFITNIVSSLTRNRGTDKTAAWATNDGNWYNEAFDGIYLVRQATKLQVGLLYSNIRTSALDPALCPTNTGTSNLYATAHISQFCLNDKSDATIAADKDERYIGTFKDTDIVLPDMEGMYQSRKFYIPNANVQDLY